MSDPSDVPHDRPVIRLAREIAAPAERIFNAFGDAATIGAWWGPTGFTTTTERLDFRVGGDWLHVMHGPDGTDYPNYSVYREIVPAERIVYDHSTAPGAPVLFRAEIRLVALTPSRTRLQLELTFADIATRDLTALRYGAVEGGRQHLMRLDAFMTGNRTVTTAVTGRDLAISRWFDAPRDRVFAAWTEARAIAHWWGPHGFHVVDCVSEPRVGGRYRIVMRGADGVDYPLDGQYRDVVAGRRLVITGSVADHPPAWHAAIGAAIRAAGGAADAVVGPIEMTIDFRDETGGTRVDVVMRLITAAEAQAFADVGAAAGWGMSFEKLDALLLAGL
jgi:uncharacterized protein YndB with AHSA1/START domain